MASSKAHRWALAVGVWAFVASTGVPSGAAQWPELTGPRARADLADGDPAVRAAAAHTLGYHGAPRPAVDALVEALPTERDSVVRRALISALVRRGDPSAQEVLIEALAADGTPDRAAAAHALGNFESEESVHALTDALEDQDVAGAAERALVRLGPRAVPHLILAARRRPTSIGAVVALGRIGDQRAVPALIGLLADERVEVRVATLEALAAMGAERAGRSVAALIDAEAPEVRLAAIAALGVVGGPPHAPLLAALVEQAEQVGQAGQDPALGASDHAGASVRRAALRALVALDPSRAIPLLERFAADGNRELGPLAVELVLGLRIAAAAPLLHGLVAEGTRAEEAASALAELEGGAGLSVLTHVAAGEGAAGGVLRAVAVCLRRYGAIAADADIEAGYRALRVREDDRGLLLRAIARDDTVHELIARRLDSEDPRVRAIAALAAEVHPSPALFEGLAARLAAEPDHEAFRRIASALLVGEAAREPLAGLGHLGHLVQRFADPDVAPEAMALAGEAYGTADRWTQRRVGRAIRHALRSGDPRVRAGAAWALARTGDTSARRALAVALDDPAREVRLGAARALASLGASGLGALVRGRLRVEEDEDVAQALADLLSTERAFPAEGLRGDQVLRVRIVPRAGAASQGIPVDVLLPDGRYLRMNTLPSGELLVVDLPSGTADVRVRVGAAP